MNTFLLDAVKYLTTLNWEQIGANIIAGYSFVIAHGGIRTMWSKFAGPKQTTITTDTKQNEKVNP